MPIFPPVDHTNPSLYERMQKCFLQAAFSKWPSAEQFVPKNPKALLGEACHDVLHAVSSGANETFETLWDNAVQKCVVKLKNTNFEQRQGNPTTWPGYHLVFAALRVRVEQIRHQGKISVATTKSEREKPFSAFGGKLRGRPDVVYPDEIIDYKTGNIYETVDAEENPTQLKESHQRQLKLYAAIVADVKGKWPKTASVVPLAGQKMQIEVKIDECQSEAVNALELLDKFNARIMLIERIADLATPSAHACSNCDYQILCEAFWQQATKEWQPRYLSVEGVLVAQPSPLQQRSELALSMQPLRGTGSADPFTVILDPALHVDISSYCSGDVVRMTGLTKTHQGTIWSTNQTIVLRLKDLPELCKDI